MSSELSRIMKLEVPIIVRLGERPMSVGELLSLGPGSILELHKDADDPLELLVNNERIGVGEAVKVGENFGVRLLHVGDQAERVQAMAGNSTGEADPDGEDEDDIAAQLLASQF